MIGRWLGAGAISSCLLSSGGSRLTFASQAPQVPPGSSATESVDDIRAAIRLILEADASTAVAPATAAAARRDRMALYAATNDAPVWTESGRPTDVAGTALSLLRGSAEDGLDPNDYDTDSLTGMAAAMEIAPPQRPADVAVFDTALSLNLLRYMRELRLGRVDPRDLGLHISRPVPTDDFPSILRAAVSAPHLQASIDGLRPALQQYAALTRVLGQYQARADPESMAASFAGSLIRPGDHDPRVEALARALVNFGDLVAGASLPEGDLYAGALVDAVEVFQARHGLNADGIVGPATIDALDVPLSARIDQIELAMERLRWLPEPAGERLIVVNIPMFRLWAWNEAAVGRPALAMRVIVGGAVRTRTPVFAEEMRDVIFRPYWDVPRSIVRSEILPALAQDPAYLEREDMEIVQGTGDRAEPVAPSAEALDQLRTGALRLRQRPGPNNALGLVKFVFPNDQSIYMHGTPAQGLFSQPRRDLSHGCVRVEDPVALAAWVLQDQPPWTPDAIQAAMDGEAPRRVDLIAPIRVLIFYTTAVVMPDDGRLHFARDIYGEDRRLQAALAHRQTTNADRPPTAAPAP